MGHYASHCTKPDVCQSNTTVQVFIQHEEGNESSCKKGDNSRSTSYDDFKKEYGFNIIGTRRIDQPTTSTLEILLAQRKNGGHISKSLIFLDSQSIVSIFNNMYLLLKGSVNECESGQGLRCFCNGGYQDSNLTEEAPYFGEVWYNKLSLTNILSLAEVSKRYRITLDTSVAQEFHVHLDDGTIMILKKSKKGLYYHDVNWKRTVATTPVNKAMEIPESVAENEKVYTPREIKKAKLAKEIHGLCGYPSDRDS